MLKFDKWIDNRIVQNLFVWTFLFLILLTTIQAESKVITTSFVIGLLAPAVYVNNLFILPSFRKKPLIFFTLFTVNTILFTVISVFLIIIIDQQELELKMFVNLFGILILALTFASTIKIARDSFMLRQQEKDAELKLLKAQLDPHFLFNTLNNLYGLSVMKSDKLPSLMLKLSDLLRYSLYETKETFVSLEKEIQYLENYMSLEQIRLENTTDIKLFKTGNLSSKKIAPMLFIIFVENAFKHLGNTKDKKNSVCVSIKEINDKLIFTCKNSIDPIVLSNTEIEKGKNGIGLQNVKKRLSLLYPEKHSLNFKDTSETFSVELSLNL